jgi:hypothetical protein
MIGINKVEVLDVNIDDQTIIPYILDTGLQRCRPSSSASQACLVQTTTAVSMSYRWKFFLLGLSGEAAETTVDYPKVCFLSRSSYDLKLSVWQSGLPPSRQKLSPLT